MTDRHLYHLPTAPPAGTILVGPAVWRAEVVASGALIIGCGTVPEAGRLLLGDRSRPDSIGSNSASADLSEATQPASDSRLVLLHGSLLAGTGPASSLAREIEALLRSFGDFLVILLHEDLCLDSCAHLYRAGLFDNQRVPLTAERWQTCLERLANRVARNVKGRQLRDAAAITAQRLHAHRRQLQQELAHMGQELIRAQNRLESANRELADHMSQLAMLYKFGRELSNAPNWDQTLAKILQNLAEHVGADGAALVLRSPTGKPYSPRRTFRWEESSWDKVLLRLENQIASKVADGILAPGIFHFDAAAATEEGQRRIYALPLQHKSLDLGYLLLLDRQVISERKHPRDFQQFLQTIQVFLAEEVAAAQMLDRLREIGSFNTRVLDSVRSLIWVVDDLGRTIYANRSARRLLGSPSTGPHSGESFDLQVGRGRHRHQEKDSRGDRISFTRLIEDAQPELFLDGLLRLDGLNGPLLPQLMNQASSTFTGNGRITRPSGAAVPVLVQTSTMTGRAAGEQWLVIVAEDLRLAKKLEAERQRAENLAGLVEMSATLAHEIRNPLMGLSAQAELLAEQLSGDDKRARYLDVITAEVGRINETINRLLNFVRPYEPQLTPVVLSDLVGDCMDLVKPKASERGIELRTLSPACADEREMSRLRLDAAQIKQVILNLLLNALDAAPAGSEVLLQWDQSTSLEISDHLSGTTESMPGVILEVSDAGRGVSEEDRERIFRPFYTTKSTGTGLGLSISWKIVTAHGGEIRVERRDDRTVFSVLLPHDPSARGRELAQESS